MKRLLDWFAAHPWATLAILGIGGCPGQNFTRLVSKFGWPMKPKVTVPAPRRRPLTEPMPAAWEIARPGRVLPGLIYIPPDLPALVIPVRYGHAWRWATGALSDGALLARTDFDHLPAAPALFIFSLAGRWSWRSLRQQLAEWPGARAIILRARHPVIRRHALAAGAKAVCSDRWGIRFWGEGAALRRFLAGERPIYQPTS